MMGLNHWVRGANAAFRASCRLLSSTPQALEPVKRVSLRDIQRWYDQGRPLVMATAYDYPSARHCELAGIDVVLVGDSVAMVQYGHETTQKLTVDQMLFHCVAVTNGARVPYLIGDMPFGSYEVSAEDAMRNAFRFIKEGNVQAVKVEGGRTIAPTVERIVQSGIAVMGHVGLNPQRVSRMGGFRAFGRTASEAYEVVQDAVALEQAGAFALVIECVPEPVGDLVTQAVGIPTIGIGAGGKTSGQVLVYHDLVGMLQHPHHAKVTPRFCKRYGAVGPVVQHALEQYAEEVRTRAFPSEEFTPYSISTDELAELQRRYMEKSPTFAKPGLLRTPPSNTEEGASPY